MSDWTPWHLHGKWGTPPPEAVYVTPDIAFTWTCGLEHQHTIDCLWVWHDCPAVLPAGTAASGEALGWVPWGMGLHTLVQQQPLTITASVYYYECCGLHGFITNGQWIGV